MKKITLLFILLTCGLGFSQTEECQVGVSTPLSCDDVVTGSTADATDSGGNSNAANDEWFSYTGSGTAEDITLNLCNSDYDTAIRVYTDCSLTVGSQVLFNDDSDTCAEFSVQSYGTFSSDGTTTYYILVEGWNTSNGAYELALTCSANIPAPPNDLCVNAEALALDTPTTGTTAGATDNSTGAEDDTTCEGFSFKSDVWYTFVANNTAAIVNTTITGDSDQANVAVYSSLDCSQLDADSIACSAGNGGESLGVTGLTDGNTYYIRVWSDGVAARQSSNRRIEGTFTIEVVSPPPAPDCATAPITPIDGATDVSGTEEVLFSWTAPTTGPTPTAYNFYAGTTPSGTDLGLFYSGPDTFFSIPIGAYDSTFYWTVVPVNGITEASGCDVWSFTTESAPPAPDCATEPITPLDGATDVPAFNTFDLSWTAPTTGPTPTSYNIYVGTLPDGSDQGLFQNTTDTFFNVFVGAELTTLYWSVRPLNADIEASGCPLWVFTTGTTPDAPANDDLCNPAMLTIDATSAGNAFYDVNATAEAGEVEGSCFDGGINGSTWYTFVAPASGDVQISTDIAGGTNGDTEIAVYEAPTDCNDASTLGTELGCNQDIDGTNFLSTLIVTGLTEGETYYIQVDRWGTQDPGYFGIEVFNMETLSTDGQQLDADKLFSYFPNPVTNSLTLKAQNNIENISVFNMLGQEVIKTAPNTLENEMDMSSLQSGAYFVKVTVNGLIETIRIIKN